MSPWRNVDPRALAPAWGNPMPEQRIYRAKNMANLRTKEKRGKAALDLTPLYLRCFFKRFKRACDRHSDRTLVCP